MELKKELLEFLEANNNFGLIEGLVEGIVDTYISVYKKSEQSLSDKKVSEHSSVEFLEQELDKNFEIRGNSFLFDKILKQAKEMEKLTMINALVEFSKANFDIHTEGAISYITYKAESYYNETFKSE